MFIDQPPDCTALADAAAARPDFAKPAEIRAWSERQKRWSECVRLREGGWGPIAEVAREGRQVRRASFQDGRLAFRIPAVALERAGDGTVSISISLDQPRRVLTAPLPPETWTRIVAQDAAANQPQKAVKPEPGAPLVLGCHGWWATIEAADRGKSWRQELSECGRDPQAPGFAYAYELASLAVEHIPECAAARAKAEAQDATAKYGRAKPVWALIFCAGRFEPRTFNNP
ncbi:hypothetical protein [Phenylobacterium sp.]|uniref:hypothetical protein n=1 Tax=Phenylobacterium sp. TaxID=1871053 RepID=UPI0035AD77FD